VLVHVNVHVPDILMFLIRVRLRSGARARSRDRVTGFASLP
jgi:hypothetical protein